MSAHVGVPVVLNLRALLVVAALICLCVSSNVGLQLFPLPTATLELAQDVYLEEANQTWHAPQADAQSFRVPIMAQSKKRADKEPRHFDQFIVLPSDRLDLPRPIRSAFEVRYVAWFLTSVTMPPGAGRAPPSLV